ncbi:hypothetical protein A9X01_24895 [Mycobacterium asiaticum]|uniref:Uncharacterized protein n=1 Tax=Mycobacterium asiaticum TaxID=1790 RepID=A0A1A3C464_MYCAS|nr:hypothetical protein A9X01_24895 [Mycobacterium asiaticum]
MEGNNADRSASASDIVSNAVDTSCDDGNEGIDIATHPIVARRAGVNSEVTERTSVGELTPEQFTALVLLAAAPPDRVGQVVARLVGDHLTIGPLEVGPGGIASATARGRRGRVRVATCDHDYWRQIVIVPIELRVEVRIAGRLVRYRGQVEVQTRFRLRLDPPCTVTVELEEVQKHYVRTTVDPVGFGARLIGWVGGVDQIVAEQVLCYVRDLVATPEFEAAMHIDVAGLLDRAWDAGLVVTLPAG